MNVYAPSSASITYTFGRHCPEENYPLLQFFGWAHDSLSGDHSVMSPRASGCLPPAALGCGSPWGERQAVMLSFVECFQLQVPVTGHCPQPSRRKSSINNLYILLLHVLFITANNFAVGWTMCCVLSDTHLRERHGLSR